MKRIGEYGGNCEVKSKRRGRQWNNRDNKRKTDKKQKWALLTFNSVHRYLH